jgi:hypothetical protein
MGHTALRNDGVLRSSALLWCSAVFCAMAHIHSPHAGVCCNCHLNRDAVNLTYTSPRPSAEGTKTVNIPRKSTTEEEAEMAEELQGRGAPTPMLQARRRTYGGRGGVGCPEDRRQ